jgi:hypothetical protein
MKDRFKEFMRVSFNCHGGYILAFLYIFFNQVNSSYGQASSPITIGSPECLPVNNKVYQACDFDSVNKFRSLLESMQNNKMNTSWMLLEIGADWCPYCQYFGSVFSRANSILNRSLENEFLRIPLAYEYTLNRSRAGMRVKRTLDIFEIISKNTGENIESLIKGYPTFLFFSPLKKKICLPILESVKAKFGTPEYEKEFLEGLIEEKNRCHSL